MIEIKEVNEKLEWEKLLDQFSQVTFLQSWNWGELEKFNNHDAYRLAFYNEKDLFAVVTVIHIKAKRGDYLQSMLGPVFINNSVDKKEVFDALVSYAKKMKVDFLRIGPLVQESGEAYEEFSELGFRSRVGQNQGAENTLLIDLTKSEDEILASMRKNTRYYIKRAQRDGVTMKIFEQSDDEGIKGFTDLYNETLDRVGFVSHKGIEKEFEVFVQDKQAIIVTAYYQDTPLSSGVFILYRDQAIYHHGATSSKMPKVPAGYLMLWEAIKYSKDHGKDIFNLWGVVSDEQTKHPWYGFSRFKRGFSETESNYIRMQDYPLNLKYYLTRVYEYFEGKRKGY